MQTIAQSERLAEQHNVLALSTSNSVTSSTNGALASSLGWEPSPRQVAIPPVSTVLTNSRGRDGNKPTGDGPVPEYDTAGRHRGGFTTLLYQTDYPGLVGADSLQKAGITGKGVTVAILDSGLWQDLGPELRRPHPGLR